MKTTRKLSRRSFLGRVVGARRDLGEGDGGGARLHGLVDQRPHRRVFAVAGAKGVVAVEVTEGGQLSAVFRVSSLFALVERRHV